ncbi:MAG: hypothetical protein JW806_01580 [Sedimentisphaerales bacterium]|nr:hypothetical protein [Sedimentisphaerales bacterium]
MLNSTDEQTRIDAAVELLKSSSSQARQVLLKALENKENPAVQVSICKALVQFRNFPNLVPDRNDFLVPLMTIIRTQNGEMATLAARASLMYSYQKVKNYIKNIIDDPALSDSIKKNAIYALQIRPDKEAVSMLVNLLDSKDVKLASAAADALTEWIPAANDEKLWLRKAKGLKYKSRTDVFREKLLTQEEKTRRLCDEVVEWQKRYVSSLEIIYLNTADEESRGKFIAENLAFDQSPVKQWAIEKINMWRKSGKPLPLDILQKPLVNLVSDPDPAIRLATAKLLGVLTNVNSVDALFTQLKEESKPDVKTQILISLAYVCNFALSPGAEIEISSEVRTETLKIAADFLKDSNPIAAAEVIRNLLLQNGLEEAQVKPYFKLIANMFKKADDEQTRGRLLEEMARLCGSDSFYMTIAGGIFNDIFAESINSKNNQIATPAVIGLIRIDQISAFELLKKKGFANHPSMKVRSELVSIAGQMGTADDLDWLGPIVKNAESDDEEKQAVDAMMNIFQHCHADVLFKWVQEFAFLAKTKKNELILARTRALFEMAEKKAEADQDMQLLFSIRYSMAQYCSDLEWYDLAAKYYGILLQSGFDPAQAPQITAKLLNVHLYSGQAEAVKQIVTNFLLSSDFLPDAELAMVLNDYFMKNKDAQQSKRIFDAIASIKIPADNPRPLWTAQLEEWEVFMKLILKMKEDPNISEKSDMPAEPNTLEK